MLDNKTDSISKLRKERVLSEQVHLLIIRR